MMDSREILIIIWMWLFVSMPFCYAQGPGSAPVLSVTDAEGEQVNITCVSNGWSLQPTVTWKDREGKEVKHNSTVMYQKDTDDLVSVSSWLLFSPSESEGISCSVSSSDQEKRESRMLALGPETSTALASKPSWFLFMTVLAISLLIIGVLSVFLFISHNKREQENPRDIEKAGSLKKTDQLDEITPLKPEILDKTEAPPVNTLSKAEISEERPETADKETSTGDSEIDWENMNKSKAHLTLDASTCHKRLTVKNGGKEVGFDRGVLKSPKPYQPSKTMVDVLCKEKFESGCHYWEVIVLDVQRAAPAGLSWYVGVTSNDEKKRENEPLTPENGYWVLCYERGKGFYVNSGLPGLVLVRDLFSTLGVYLDMTNDTLSFFDVDSQTHLHTFTHVMSDRALIPLLSPGQQAEHFLRLK